VLGGSGYMKGAAPSTQFPTATGWGAFKQITVEGNSTDFANTDYYAYLLGQQTFGNPEATNINVFVTPGIDFVNNSNLIEDAIDMIESQRADSLYIMTCPDYNMFVDTTTSVATDLIYPTEAVDNLDTVGIDSNYTATYYPWVLTRDTVNNTQIYLPPTAEVCRNLALTDNISFPWFASAGYTRGIVNSVKARKKLTQDDRDTLYQGRINPIATFSDVGTLIWGNKTTQVAESALDRINVRRLLLQARKLISAVAVRLLFEQNDDKVRQDFLDSVNPILDSIRRDRGLIDFRVVVTNTPEDLDRNTMTGKIYLKPTKALEFIDIEFLITPTGASFENI
jgi:phage tail sheath protein FI